MWRVIFGIFVATTLVGATPSDEEKGMQLFGAAREGDMGVVTDALDLGAPASWVNTTVSAESAALHGEWHPCVQGASLL